LANDYKDEKNFELKDDGSPNVICVIPLMQDSCDAKSGQLLEHIFRSRDVVPMSQGLKLRNINFTLFTAQATVMKLKGLISILLQTI
jgi:hypothetical protein